MKTKLANLPDKISTFVADLIVGRRHILGIILLLITGFLFYRGLNTPIYTKLSDLTPKHPFTELAKKYEVFGGANRILLVIKANKGDIFNHETLKKIIEISQELQFIPGVDRNKVYSIGVNKAKNFLVTKGGLEFPPLMYPEPPTTREGIEALKENIYRNPLYYGRLVSADSTAALISAEFFEDLKTGLVYDRLSKIMKKYTDENTSIYLEGNPYLYGVFENLLPQTGKILILTIVAIFIVTYLFAKDWRLMVVPAITMVLSGIWGLGFMNLLGFNLDPITLVVPVLISARALSHSLQFNWRVNEELLLYGDVKKAVHGTVKSMFYPGLAGIITDAVGIVVIMLIPIPLMYKLGLSFFMWAMCVIVTALIINPILYLYMPPMKRLEEWREGLKGGFLEGTIIERLSLLSTGEKKKKAWMVLGVAGIFSIIVIYINLQLFIGDVQPGSPLLKADSKYNQDVKVIAETFPGLMDPLMIIIDSKKADGIINPNLLTDMANFQAQMMLVPGVYGTTSIVDLVKMLQMKLYEDNPKMSIIPATDSGVFQTLYLLQGGGAEAGDFDQYYTFDYRASNVIAFVKDHTSQTVEEVISQCKMIIDKMKKDGYEFQLAAGRVGMVAAINEAVGREQLFLSITVFILTFAFSALFMQSVTAGLLLLIPLGLANLFTLAYMVLVRLGLNIQTLPVTTIAVGIGVDYGLYLMSRMREEFRGDLDEAIKVSIKTAGHASIVTGVIIICGVIFWNFSTIKFQADMGLLFAIVTLFHLLGTIILLPALVKIVRPKFVSSMYLRKEGGEA